MLQMHTMNALYKSLWKKINACASYKQLSRMKTHGAVMQQIFFVDLHYKVNPVDRYQVFATACLISLIRVGVVGQKKVEVGSA